MEAVKTLNFTVAAQNIHMTQPAFSRNIAAMEDELGFSLFLRSKQSGLRVTPAGLAMYNGLVKLNTEYGMLREQAARINRGEEGELVIDVYKRQDQILVLDEGEIVGKGTHEELMKHCTVYQEIAKSQMSAKELGLTDGEEGEYHE